MQILSSLAASALLSLFACGSPAPETEATDGATCYLAYDMMECPDWFGIDGAYLSNYGRNFQIAVEP